MNVTSFYYTSIFKKEDYPDIRNSKVFDIIDELEDYGCTVDAYDPWIDEKDVEQKNFAFSADPFKTDKSMILSLLQLVIKHLKCLVEVSMKV